MPLPLVLEQTFRSFILTGILGGTLVAILGYAYLRKLRQGWSTLTWRDAAALPALALGVLLILLPVGWEFRVDREGIALRAPFDLIAGKPGRVPWSALRNVRIGHTSGRSSYPTLEFVRDDYLVVSLGALDAVPPAFWPALVAAIEANATHFAFQPSAQEWVKRLQSLGEPVSGVIVGLDYVLRDGDGRVYR